LGEIRNLQGLVKSEAILRTSRDAGMPVAMKGQALKRSRHIIPLSCSLHQTATQLSRAYGTLPRVWWGG